MALVVAALGWFVLKRYRCHRHNAAFERRIDGIRRDASQQLKIGAKKADVARFYAEHGIPFEVVSWPLKEGVGLEAIGTLYTVGGCAPLGCGTNNALIGVRVRVNADGSVVGEFEIVSLYTDCV
jgi:hypothetical protein